MMGILERGNGRGYRVYLLGAEEDVVRTVAERIQRDYPNVVIAGYRNGYFTAAEEAAIAAAIAAAKPDVLLVAITSPKKERFLAQWGPQLGVSVYHGVGGSFDVYSGKVLRAPPVWQRLGLEWLYRLLQEPGRLWRRYLHTNSMFIWLVIKDWLRNASGRKR
jgi:N-acetylglucosaminyldiphosphoundecaprenol N-acetyl-beta-D-mannosaminyltransferase